MILTQSFNLYVKWDDSDIDPDDQCAHQQSWSGVSLSHSGPWAQSRCSVNTVVPKGSLKGLSLQLGWPHLRPSGLFCPQICTGCGHFGNNTDREDGCHPPASPEVAVWEWCLLCGPGQREGQPRGALRHQCRAAASVGTVAGGAAVRQSLCLCVLTSVSPSALTTHVKGTLSRDVNCFPQNFLHSWGAEGVGKFVRLTCLKEINKTPKTRKFLEGRSC